MNVTLRRQALAQKIWELGPGLWQLAAAAEGVLLSAASVFGGLRPLGLGLVFGIGAPYALTGAAGAALGYLLLAPAGDSLRYIAAVAAALAGRGLFKKSFLPSAAGGCGVLLIVQLMLSVSGLSTPAQAMGSLGEAILALGFGWLLRRTRTSRTGWLGPISPQGVVLGLGALPAFCAIPAGPFLPGAALLGAAGLVLAYRGRVRECAGLCVAGGAVLAAAR